MMRLAESARIRHTTSSATEGPAMALVVIGGVAVLGGGAVVARR